MPSERLTGPPCCWLEFMEGRVAEQLRHRASGCVMSSCNPIAFLGMTADEYADWILWGDISDRCKRVWQSTYEVWVRERVAPDHGHEITSSGQDCPERKGT